MTSEDTLKISAVAMPRDARDSRAAQRHDGHKDQPNRCRHTAPKTVEVLKNALGALFIDEAYSLYRSDNQRDDGQEAIEILLQVRENNRDDLVVILAGCADRMESFFQSNLGFRSCIATTSSFRLQQRRAVPDRAAPVGRPGLRADAGGASRAGRIRRGPPHPAHFANTRSARNALDRARLRQAHRLFKKSRGPLDAEALSTIDEADIRASRVFSGGLSHERKESGA